jgi:hypothetical protein
MYMGARYMHMGAPYMYLEFLTCALKAPCMYLQAYYM